MKISLNWLKKHLETKASAEEINLKLTSIGHVVDNEKNLSAALKNFQIVEIVKADPHPNADRLRVCQVSDGSDALIQVVCGAPNARAGIKAVLARPGMTVPASGLMLKETKIRDVASFGMLCSERELGLSDADSGGIIEVPLHAMTGTDYADFLNLADVIYDLDITPNRGDCLSHYGVARDLAATGIGTLRAPETLGVVESFKPEFSFVSDLKDHETACSSFAVRVIRNLQNKESPSWLQGRLKSIGLRPISAVVDVTNFIMHDMGRPMHAFDADKITGDMIVRMACNGERLMALDEKEYDLDSSMLVVADQQGPVSLAGVMGGLHSGCTQTTTSVILESAFFDPGLIARTGRALGIHSDARHRFERGVDAALVNVMLDLATQMIIDICGGEASQKMMIGKENHTMPQITFKPDMLKRLSGLDVDTLTQTAILKSLGFKVENSAHFLKVEVPTWRHDCQIEADLVEEILRIQGYDCLEETPLPVNAVDTTLPLLLSPGRTMTRLRLARRALAGVGYHEVMTWSFLKAETAWLFGGGGEDLHIENPISADLSVMRPTLLPNLLDHMRYNNDRSLRDIMLFEVGPVFKNATPQGQTTMIAGVREGKRHPQGWNQEADAADVFDIKAAVLDVLSLLDVDVTKLKITRETESWYHPGRSFKIQLGPKNVIAMGGELHPLVKEHFDVKGSVLGFEIFYSALPQSKIKSVLKKNLILSPYQVVQRDFAFIVDDTCQAQEVIQSISKIDSELITAVTLFDVFKGDGVEPGKKSLAITVRLEPKHATLTEIEISKISEAIIASVKQMTGGVLRA
ncbi:MAG: phenylalanine--tRNA ligase subunit beta [Alphaproteobacteria bacterium]|nr:phenylalanine--tRNA ligase subunit beta [Alphaproteobacteria bacterium]